MAKTKKDTQKKSSGTPRRKRGAYTDLPVFIDGACEFSDDPTGLDNAVWLVRALKVELIGGGGPLGNLWQEMRDEIDALCVKTEGAPRIEGDWLLLYVGFVMSQKPEMRKFWKERLLRDLLPRGRLRSRGEAELQQPLQPLLRDGAPGDRRGDRRGSRPPRCRAATGHPR